MEDQKSKKKTRGWSVTSNKNPVTNETTINNIIRNENGTINKETYTVRQRNLAQASKHSVMADLHDEHMKAVEKTRMKAEGSNSEEESSKQ